MPGNVATLTSLEGNLTIGGTITSFPNFALLASIGGNLVIDGITTATLTNLASIFPALTEVQGSLNIINNNHVTTISGLGLLDDVGGTLLIQGNAALTAVPPFVALASITGDINIQNNAALTAVPPFAALSGSTGLINIINNAALTSIPAFATLTSIAGTTISNNGMLTSISLLSKITRATSLGVSILNNDKLETIAGFDALETINQNLIIDGNVLLTAIPTFNALTSVGEDLSISGNVVLTTITGFEALSTITRNFLIRGNSQLASCCAFLPIAKDDLVPKNIEITGNKTGCDSKGEIRTACIRNITITQNSDFPSDVATLTRLDGNLTIGGAITSFPNFAALEVIEGNLDIDTASPPLP